MYQAEYHFECNTCRVSYATESSLKRHMSYVHPRHNLECKTCQKTYPHLSSLNRHMAFAHQGKSFDCRFCQHRYASQSSLSRHLASAHSGKSYECEICKKKFTLQCSLKRHTSNFHPLNGERNCFTCDNCKKTFASKDNLTRHIQIHDKKPVQCSTCFITFSSEETLLKHIKKSHGVAIDESDVEYFECDICSGKFTCKNSLITHIRRIHTSQNEEERKKNGKIKCLKCGQSFRRKSTLFCHYEKDHKVVLEFENLSFPSCQDFTRWLNPCYVRVHRWSTAVHYVQKFSCHRSGVYFDKCKANNRKRQRHLKLAGSKKLQGWCPGEVVMRQRRSDGVCVVTHQKVHLKHALDDVDELKFIPQFKLKERLEDAAPPVDRVPELVPLAEDENRSDGCDRSQDDQAEATEMGVGRNVAEAADALAEVRTADEAVNADADAFVSRHKDSVLFYKRRGELDAVYGIFDEKDFVLVYQDEFQRRSLLRYAKKAVAFDATRGSGDDDNELRLHAILVPSYDEREALAVAFLLTNRTEQPVMDVFARCLKDRVGDAVRTHALLTDVDPMYARSWCRAMGAPRHSLYGVWHVRDDWSRRLRESVAEAGGAAGGDEDGERALRDVGRRLSALLAEDADERGLADALAELLAAADGHPAARPLVEHLRDAYADRVEAWAPAYRRAAGVNVRPDAVRAIFGRVVGGEMRVQTTAAGLRCVDEYVKYCVFRYKSARPRYLKRIRVLRRKHAEAESYADKGAVLVEYDDDYRDEDGSQVWRVGLYQSTSDGILEMYCVQRTEAKECDEVTAAEAEAEVPSKGCELFCDECECCAHEYQCSCPDGSKSGRMCEHVHALRLFLKKETTVVVGAAGGPSATDDTHLYETIELPGAESSDDGCAPAGRPNAQASRESFHRWIDEEMGAFADAIKRKAQPANEDERRQIQADLRRLFRDVEAKLDARRTNGATIERT